MDREERIKELINPFAVRKMVFSHIGRIAEDFRAKKESQQIEEFVEFALARDAITASFGAQGQSEQHFADFVLTISLALSDAIVENNKRWLQVLSSDE